MDVGTTVMPVCGSAGVILLIVILFFLVMRKRSPKEDIEE
jgi:hypothetical protein